MAVSTAAWSAGSSAPVESSSAFAKTMFWRASRMSLEAAAIVWWTASDTDPASPRRRASASWRIWSVIWRTTSEPATRASTATNVMTSVERAPNGDFSHPRTLNRVRLELRTASRKALSRDVYPGHEKGRVCGRTTKGREWSSGHVTFGDGKGMEAPSGDTRPGGEG